ncbi:MAG TPA: 4-hydroxyphenylpyruvate dioxygenase [Streptosporangiaceae bacterium]|nr:4-hydroxyphenylpyruvate dioxygenase [Streptosporangiaceae bacterium]
MRIQGIDHVEYYVGDLAKSAATLCDAFGFRIAGRQAPGAGPAGQRSLLLRQGQIRLLLTTAGSADHPVADYVRQHGDGVAVIAFRTDDVRRTFAETVAAGAAPLASPAFATAGQSTVGTAVVSGFGDVQHKLIERTGADSEFAPGTIEMTRPGDHIPGACPGRPDDAAELLVALDHIAVCLPADELDNTVRFYRDVFGLAQIYDERIEVGTQAMLSKVVQDESARVTFTLIEPDLSREPGQIDEFLKAHGGAGVQHLAFRTSDIAAAVRTISSRGVEFLIAPAGYYQTLEARLGQLAIPITELRELNVLADRDRWGQMFQIFARSTHERHTFFIELIERKGALTFGTRNIKALYEALEDEHAGITN